MNYSEITTSYFAIATFARVTAHCLNHSNLAEHLKVRMDQRTLKLSVAGEFKGAGENLGLGGEEAAGIGVPDRHERYGKNLTIT